MRLPPRPGEVIDRSLSMAFAFGEVNLSAYVGDSIASALAADGMRVIARSPRLGRPRGIVTADRWDPSCWLEVDGEAYVPAAHRLVVDGLRAAGPAPTPAAPEPNPFERRPPAPGGLLSSGRRLLGAAVRDRLLRRLSSLSGAPSEPALPGRRTAPRRHLYRARHAHPDVLVVGAGPAGIAAALGAAGSGARVLLVDADHEVGGHLRWRPGAAGPLAELRSQLERAEGIEVLTDTSVLHARVGAPTLAMRGSQQEGEGDELYEVHAGHVVLAVGLFERPYLFEGNDLPGVMRTAGAARLLNLWSVRPGRRAVLACPGGDEALVEELTAAGVEVVEVVDLSAGPSSLPGRPQSLVRALGAEGVEEVHLAGGRRVAADLVLAAAGHTLDSALLTGAGVRLQWSPGVQRPTPAECPPGVSVVGGLVGDASLDGMAEHARAVGAAAGAGNAAAPALPSSPRAERRRPAELRRSGTHGVIELADDVLSAELVDPSGASSAELRRRFAALGASPSLDRAGRVAAASVMAEALGVEAMEVNAPRGLTPFAVPVPLGTLAAGAPRPLQRTPLTERHRRAGARLGPCSGWLDAIDYSDDELEVQTARTAVGLRDTGAAALFECSGPDTGRLLAALDGLAPLQVGRVGAGRRWLRAPAGRADAVRDALDELLQLDRASWRVHVTEIGDAWASVLLLGPRAAAVLGAAGWVGDPAALAEGQVANGALGELAVHVWRLSQAPLPAFELRTPAGFGHGLWDALTEAGALLGLTPIGAQAERRLWPDLCSGRALLAASAAGVGSAA
ncbi:MAG: FAD-dependent oxidoreductase [Acidimicrobiales bacterium]